MIKATGTEKRLHSGRARSHHPAVGLDHGVVLGEAAQQVIKTVSETFRVVSSA